MGSGDLLGGRYPLTYPFYKGVGAVGTAAQGNISVRSNLEYPFLGPLSDQAAALVSGEATLVPVPVEPGDEIATVSVLVGATAASSPTHSAAALYQGTLTKAAICGSQSVDGGLAAIDASATFNFTLGSKYIVQPADCPFGYIYVAITVTASVAVPSLCSATFATACQYAWFADTPLFAATSGSGLGGTLPSSFTLASGSASSKVPAVFLS